MREQESLILQFSLLKNNLKFATARVKIFSTLPYGTDINIERDPKMIKCCLNSNTQFFQEIHFETFRI